jgi:hypothetical protein
MGESQIWKALASSRPLLIFAALDCQLIDIFLFSALRDAWHEA